MLPLFFNFGDSISSQAANEEQADDMRRMYFVLSFFIGMVVSGFYAWSEFRYTFFSTVYDGQVTELKEVEQIRVRRRFGSLTSNQMVLEVAYSYSDGKVGFYGSQQLPLSSPYVIGQKIQVQHLAMDDKDLAGINFSRIKGTGDTTYVWAFFGCMAFLIGSVIWIAQQMDQPYQKSSARVNPIKPTKLKKRKRT